MATRSCWSHRQTRSMRRSTKSSISILSATSRRSRASSAFPRSCWSIHRFQPRRVTTAMRAGALPDVPTFAEFVPGYEASFWYGVGAPKATPAGIVEKLNKEINAGLADPKIKARPADLGGTPLLGSPADFGKLIADETEKWGQVIQAPHIYPDRGSDGDS